MKELADMGKRRGIPVLQAKRRRCRASVRPSHRRKIRRGEYGYLSGRRIPRKGHAPGIKAERGNAGRRKQSWTLGDIGASTVRSAGGVGLRSPAGPRRLGTATRISASLSRRLSAFFKSASDQDPKAAKFAVLTPSPGMFVNVRNAPRVVIPPPSETPRVSACKPLCAILPRKPSVYPLSLVKANVGRLCRRC